jgi:tetratricopeptide (TPR) repeat protein
MSFTAINRTIGLILGLFLFFSGGIAIAQIQNLTPKDRDEIRSKAIGLVKDYEQMLNVLATKGTTSSDVQDILNQALSEEGRMFWDSKVNIEDDIYSLKADSGDPKDVSIQKYINDWDLFYTKGYDESVQFLDLRLSDLFHKEYSYIKVYFASQFKNKHQDFDMIYPIRRRVALIRFEKKNDQWQAWINGISFYRTKKADGTEVPQAAFEEEYKPFVKEKKARIVSSSTEIDSTITDAQISLQKQNDSLYAEAVKANLQKSQEQMRRDTLYSRAIFKGDSLLSERQFAPALDAYSEARGIKPFEVYPRSKVNEITKLISGGSTDPIKIFERQVADGDRLQKLREYEAARQSYQTALTIFPDNQLVKEKILKTDQILRNKAEIRSKYTAGNFKLALKDYARVISEDKTNPDYYFERARCYQSMNEIKKSIADLDKAIELDPNFSNALLLRANLFQKTGDFPRAISDLGSLITIDPKNEEYFYKRGLSFIQSKDYESATRDFDQSIALNPKNPQALSAKSEALRLQGKMDQALIAAEKAIELNPNYSEGHFQKGLALLQKGEDEKAASTLNRAQKLGIGSEQDKQLQQIHNEFFEQARQANASGDLEKAVLLAKRALTAKGRSPATLYFLAQQYEKTGKTNEALATLDQATFYQDSYVPAHYRKGLILLASNDVEGALEPFYKVKKLDKKNFEGSIALGDAYLKLQRYDSAMTWFGDALSLKENNPDALIRRGKCHFKMENYRRALMDFESAIKEDRRNAEAFYYKGRINKELKQTDKAIDDLNEAKDLGYHKYECALEIGSSYADLGNFGKAIKFFTDAIKIEPNKGEAFARRGLAFLADKEYKEAMADLDEAMKMDTSLSKAKYRLELGFLKLRFNEYDAAEISFNRALDFDAYDARANYGLAATYFHQSKFELSMTHFEQAFRPRKLKLDDIKRDPWMKEILKDKGFKRIQKAYF